jgi:hypothetical protein
MHNQAEVKINVDDKIQPLIQFIYDKLSGIIPIASCIGGNGENESFDCYILLIVRYMGHLDFLMKICFEYQCNYIPPDIETGNIPTYKITISDLDRVLDNLKNFSNTPIWQ